MSAFSGNSWTRASETITHVLHGCTASSAVARTRRHVAGRAPGGSILRRAAAVRGCVRLTSSSLSLSHEMHLLLHLHHSRLVSSRKWVYLRCASPLLSRTHQVAGHSCSILRRAAAVRGCVLPLRMRGATAAALRFLPPKARGTGELRTAANAHAVQHCAARRCRSLLARASPCSALPVRSLMIY